jgi:hypothetical protein
MVLLRSVTIPWSIESAAQARPEFRFLARLVGVDTGLRAIELCERRAIARTIDAEERQRRQNDRGQCPTYARIRYFRVDIHATARQGVLKKWPGYDSSRQDTAI